jgi:hypothetical protein
MNGGSPDAQIRPFRPNSLVDLYTLCAGAHKVNYVA